MKWILLITTLLGILVVSCDQNWATYSAPAGTLRIGSQESVARVCAEHGTVAPPGKQVLGCASWITREAWAINKSWVIAEEVCHMLTYGGDPMHEVCQFREVRP